MYISKLVSVLVLIFFVVNMNVNFLYAANDDSKENKVVILSHKTGQVKDKYDGDSNQKIYIVEDLHCSKSAQKNIDKILEYVQEKEGGLKIIGIEGSSKKIDTGLVANIENKRLKKRVVNTLLDRGYLTGAELYGINHYGDVELYGIEDEDLYLEDFEMLYRSLEYREPVTNVINKTEAAVARGKELLFTNKMKEIDNKREKYDNGEISGDKYLEYLMDEAKDIGIREEVVQREYQDLYDYEKIQKEEESFDFGVMEIEVASIQSLLNEVLPTEEMSALEQEHGIDYYKYLNRLLKDNHIIYEQSCPMLASYLDYLDRKDGIDEMKVLEDEDSFTDFLLQRLGGDSKDIRDIIFLDKYLKLLNDYVTNNLASEETEEFESQKYRFYDVMRDLGSRLTRVNYILENKDKIDEVYNYMHSFYQIAGKRDESITGNIIAKMNELSNTRGEGYNVAAILIGGYHSQALANILRSRGISYELIRPMSTDGSVEDLYVQRLREQARMLNVDDINTKEKTGVPIEIGEPLQDKSNVVVLPSMLALMSLFEGEVGQKIIIEIIRMNRAKLRQVSLQTDEAEEETGVKEKKAQVEKVNEEVSQVLEDKKIDDKKIEKEYTGLYKEINKMKKSVMTELKWKRFLRRTKNNIKGADISYVELDKALVSNAPLEDDKAKIYFSKGMLKILNYLYTRDVDKQYVRRILKTIFKHELEERYILNENKGMDIDTAHKEALSSVGKNDRDVFVSFLGLVDQVNKSTSLGGPETIVKNRTNKLFDQLSVIENAYVMRLELSIIALLAIIFLFVNILITIIAPNPATALTSIITTGVLTLSLVAHIGPTLNIFSQSVLGLVSRKLARMVGLRHLLAVGGILVLVAGLVTGALFLAGVLSFNTWWLMMPISLMLIGMTLVVLGGLVLAKILAQKIYRGDSLIDGNTILVGGLFLLGSGLLFGGILGFLALVTGGLGFGIAAIALGVVTLGIVGALVFVGGMSNIKKDRRDRGRLQLIMGQALLGLSVIGIPLGIFLLLIYLNTGWRKDKAGEDEADIEESKVETREERVEEEETQQEEEESMERYSKILPKLKSLMQAVEYENLLEVIKKYDGQSKFSEEDLKQPEIKKFIEFEKMVPALNVLIDAGEDAVSTRDGMSKIWGDIYSVKAGLAKGFNTDKSEGDIIDAFDNLDKIFSKSALDLIKEEYTINLGEEKVEEALADRGIMVQGVWKKKNVRVIFGGDIAGYNEKNNDLKKIKDMQSTAGANGSVIELDLGTQALLLFDKGEEQIKEVVKTGLADITTKSTTGEMVLGSGVVVKESLQQIGNRLGKKFVRDVTVDDIQNILKLFLVIRNQFDASDIGGLTMPLKEKEKWEDRVKILEKVQKDYENYGLESIDIVKVLTLGVVMYGEKGMVNETGEADYKKAKEVIDWIVQKPMGLKVKIAEEIREEKKKEEEEGITSYKVQKLYADGMVTEETFASNGRRLDINIKRGPVIELKRKGFYRIYNDTLEALKYIEDIEKRKTFANKILEVLLYVEPLEEQEKYTYQIPEDLIRQIASAA